MTPPRRSSAPVPTLTEVVRLDFAPAGPPSASAPDDGALRAALFVEPLLEDILHQLDAMLELRIRDALAPELERLAERVVKAARDEVAIGLRELVERAVAQELARRGGG